MENQGKENTILRAYNEYIVKERELSQQDCGESKKAFLEENVINYYSKSEEIVHRFAEMFKAFLKQTKGVEVQEQALEYVSLSELQDFVQNFRSRFPPSQLRKSIIEINDDDIEIPIYGDSLKKDSKFSAQKVQYKNGAWDYYISGYEECKKVKQIFDVEGKVEQSVIFGTSQLRKSGGFFGIGGKLQLWMQITNKITQDTVWRKAQDFIFIKDILHRLFPFRYIPLLEITDKELQNVNEVSKSQSIINKCQRFINNVCRQSYFIQNKYVFRFFKEKKYDNYMEHKGQSIQQPVSKIKDVQNTQGFIQLEISTGNEEIKMDYMKKGLILQRFWNNLSNFNGKIIQNFKNIEKQLLSQQKQFQKLISQFKNVGILAQCDKYRQFTMVLTMYNDVFANCRSKVNTYRQFFNEVNSKLSEKNQQYWKGFNLYTKDIDEMNNEYYSRRKVFQDKWTKKTSDKPNENKEETSKGNNLNKSIVQEMGIHENETKQFIWIEKYSKWQGYINTQYKFSFNRLFQDNLSAFQKTIQQNYDRLNALSDQQYNQ